MAFQVSFGSQQVQLTDPDSRVAQPLSPLAATLADPLAVVRGVLANPRGLPALSDITVEGDRVAIAVGDAYPLLPGLTAAIVESLLRGPVTAEGITIVTPAGNEAFLLQVREAVNASLPATLQDKCAVIMHAPGDSDSIAYLAASKEARPIYLNRYLIDADMVVTLGVARPDAAFGYHGIHGGLYPAFADADGIRRFDAPSNADWPTHRRRRREESAEAAFLAGIMFTVQVVPGLNGGAVEILAGLAEQLAAAAQQRANDVWSIDTPSAAELVVAAIDGGPSEQNWDNFARALFTARSLVAPGGAVVICSELAQPPGSSLRSLAALDGLEVVQKHLHRQRDAQASVASMLAHTLEYVNVFLISQLDDGSLEEIGLAPIHDIDELQRLINRSESTLLLPSAQHLVLRPVEPAEIVTSLE